MVASYYRVVPYLQCCHALLPTSNAALVTRPLKMLHKCCDTDVLRVLLIYVSAPSLGRCAPSRSCVYISQTPRYRVTTY